MDFNQPRKAKEPINFVIHFGNVIKERTKPHRLIKNVLEDLILNLNLLKVISTIIKHKVSKVKISYFINIVEQNYFD